MRLAGNIWYSWTMTKPRIPEWAQLAALAAITLLLAAVLVFVLAR